MLVVDQVAEKELLVTKLASMELGLRNNITNPEGDFPGARKAAVVEGGRGEGP